MTPATQQAGRPHLPPLVSRTCPLCLSFCEIADLPVRTTTIKHRTCPRCKGAGIVWAPPSKRKRP